MSFTSHYDAKRNITSCHLHDDESRECIAILTDCSVVFCSAKQEENQRLADLIKQAADNQKFPPPAQETAIPNEHMVSLSYRRYQDLRDAVLAPDDLPEPLGFELMQALEIIKNNRATSPDLDL